MNLCHCTVFNAIHAKFEERAIQHILNIAQRIEGLDEVTGFDLLP